jgi:hypothetical protein
MQQASSAFGGLEAVNLSTSEAGGLECFPLLLFGLGIVLVVDLQRLLAYNNIRQQGMCDGFSQRTLYSQ